MIIVPQTKFMSILICSTQSKNTFYVYYGSHYLYFPFVVLYEQGKVLNVNI